MYKKIVSIVFCLLYINKTFNQVPSFDQPMNFVTVADNEHFPWISGLVESIYKFNPKKTINLVVFNIGLTPEQKTELETKYHAQVPYIEMVNPDLCTKFVVRPNGRLARGWYAWKPVIFYQALQLFDYFLYVDSGKRITGPCDLIFHHILEHGYFFLCCGHDIRPMTTQYVIKKFGLDDEGKNNILDKWGLEAGNQGISKKIFNDYVKPLYELAHDLRNFEDDGSAPWGFGGSRHDQTLFSIQAQLMGYKIYTRHDQFVIHNIKYPYTQYISGKILEENPLAKTYNLD